MVFAISPKHNVRSFEGLRQKSPAIRIAASPNDETNFIGYIGAEVMKAHGVDKPTLHSWRGSYMTATPPEQVLALVMAGEADTIVQEAIMTPWWESIIED
jgi:hypothetical protein